MDTKDLCLGVLSLGDASGYDIRKQLEETFVHFMDISPSGVYPALKQLAFQGLVTATVIPQVGRPNKTIYALTEEGRKVLADALAASEGRHKVRSELLTLMFFAGLAPPHKLRQVLLARAAELDGYIAATKAWSNSGARDHATPGQHFVADYAVAVMEAESRFLHENVEALIEAIAAGARRPAHKSAQA